MLFDLKAVLPAGSMGWGCELQNISRLRSTLLQATAPAQSRG
ncbi:hypothetical protein [Niabella aquatica]